MTRAIEAGFAAIEVLENPGIYIAEVPNAEWAGELITSRCISYARDQEDLLDGINISGVHGFGMTAEQMYWRAAAVVKAAAAVGIQANYWSTCLPEKATSLEASAEVEAANARAMRDVTGERVILDGFSMGGGIVSRSAQILEGQGVVAVVNATTSPFVPINRPIKALKTLPREFAEVPRWGEQPMLKPMSEMLANMGGHILEQLPRTPNQALERIIRLGRLTRLGLDVALTSNPNSAADVSKSGEVAFRVSHATRDGVVNIWENQDSLNEAGYEGEMAVIHTSHISAVVHPAETGALYDFVVSLAGRDEPPLTPLEQAVA